MNASAAHSTSCVGKHPGQVPWSMTYLAPAAGGPQVGQHEPRPAAPQPAEPPRHDAMSPWCPASTPTKGWP
jgi:hypothetical protein